MHRVAVLLLPPVVGFRRGHRADAVRRRRRRRRRRRSTTWWCAASTTEPVRDDQRFRHGARRRGRGAGDRRHRRHPRHAVSAGARRRRAGPRRRAPRSTRSGRAPGMVSICTGAFVLAAAGLLDGRPRDHALEVRRRRCAGCIRGCCVDENVLFVDDGDVLTSAGLAAGIDLCLHIIRSDHGAQVANAVARYCVVPPWREGGQAQFIDRHLPVAGRRLHRRHPRVGAATPRRGPDRRAAGPARAHEPAHLQPPLPRGDRAGAGHVDPQPAGRPRPRAARVPRPARRRGGPALRAWAPAATCATICAAARDVAVELPQGVSGRLNRPRLGFGHARAADPVHQRPRAAAARRIWVAPNATVIGQVTLGREGQRLVRRGPAGRVRTHRDRRRAPTSRTT